MVESLERLGKQVVMGLSGDRFAVIHLMIAGRFRWLAPGKKPPGKLGLAAFETGDGTLWVTEAGTKRRASLHLVEGREALARFDRGGLEPLDASLEEFARRLRLENHTIKRSLTDPRILSGIGNAYSDEILHAARLSPLTWTSRLSDEEMQRLHVATREILTMWTERLRADAGDRFPEKVTAFRPEMAMHGKLGQPCPVCRAPVQRIRYAEHETNYCARCQTGGKRLADRALSRILREDWPRDMDDL
jgi:formamidopyrimidine-DNA glycosylase